MRVGGDAGDIIDGDVGEDGRQVSVDNVPRIPTYSHLAHLFI